ncbi:hypothetical protein N7520_005289 [Penicillium odoratum]|uniref:uncharacterized protein n=1 Tax=Penicillium odoratum TaxID=1167516 RepID=UPI0025469691|nr:uncharacterized protein N7520_005289 [Penicillium odoratum]KAJ5765730.1 hypothetical protein N7520_005289 [Penicillium odoratum]
MASINLLQQPHVELLEAITMLVTVHLLSGNVQAGAIGNTLAAQYVLRIGGNTRDCFIKASTFAATGDERFRINYHLRNLFWICYQQDKELCLRSGQPPTLSEDNCDLDLPVGYEQNWNNSLAIDNSTAPVFPGDLRLSQIKSKAYFELYSRRALEKNGALVLSAIRQLDDDLEEWRMSIPADYRPTMLFNEKTPHRPRHFNIRSLMLRLEYYHCVAYIHQACARFQTMTGSPDQEIQGVTSSLTFSMAACRSSLYYLVAVQDTLVPKDFWLTLFYTLSAILTVFCFLISNPGTPEARNDLEIIRKIAAQLRRLGKDDLFTEEHSQTERVWKVITALEGLAKRTIEKQIS